jgi:hypothetical protein
VKPLPLLLSLLVLLAACVTTQSRESRASSMASHQIDPALINKVRQGSRLTVPELAAILGSGVPEAPLLTYVKETGAIYDDLKAQDINLLTYNKASDAFVDYLLQTSRLKRQQPNLQAPQGPQLTVDPAIVPYLDR